MFAKSFSSWLNRRGIHYGFVVATVTFFTMLIMAAALGLPGAMMKSFNQEFGWSVDEVSSAVALRFFLFGLMGPFAALLMERYGLKKVMCGGLFLVGTGLALATQVTALWHLFVLWGVMLGVGTGMTALVLGAVVSSRWFTKKRGLVLGIFSASTATGQLLFLPIATWLIENIGWRVSVLPIVAGCGLMAILVILLMSNRPSEVGLASYGDVSAPTTGPATATMVLNFKTPFIALADAAKTQTFWILAGTFFICGLSTSGLVQTHFITLCGDNGMDALPAASVLAMMGLFDVVGTVMSGWLSDRYDNRKLLFWYYGLRGLSLFWLPFSTFSVYGLSIFAMFYGLDWIATVPPTVKLAGAAFGKERVGMVFGWIFAAHQLGSAVAAYGAGLVRVTLLTYNPALIGAGLFCLVAAISIFWVPKIKSVKTPA
ncbi:MFS transporter [Polynucleobacter kasalickyi]|uniref:Sugar phosphate permease n=1 Tax=Polynucleobacter kasalickyi TaxID=1938817 RepID=A0A1W1Z710_9BURK|nr:MFS transporter [Polynucleobacter kasalickyi]SMC44203.1 Sugar phosphate permease [Polynucleobacter kasalickyi]